MLRMPRPTKRTPTSPVQHAHAGTSGTCNSYSGAWSSRKVTCGELCPPTAPPPSPTFSLPVGPPAPAFAVSSLVPLNGLSTATLGGYAPGQVRALRAVALA